jgi:hypothetical protein
MPLIIILIKTNSNSLFANSNEFNDTYNKEKALVLDNLNK